jgi:tripartite-type tricarboxylate transporter receptor subunit TctC
MQSSLVIAAACAALCAIEGGHAAAAQDFQEKLIMVGSDPESTTPEQFAQIIRDDVAAYAKIVKAAGISPE